MEDGDVEAEAEADNGAMMGYWVSWTGFRAMSWTWKGEFQIL